MSTPKSSQNKPSISKTSSTLTPASTSGSASATANMSIPVQPSKIAKNKRLPATMIDPSGNIATSKKSKAKMNKDLTKRQKDRLEKGKERAVELAGKLEEKLKGREERKAKRKRAKQAWE